MPNNLPSASEQTRRVNAIKFKQTAPASKDRVMQLFVEMLEPLPEGEAELDLRVVEHAVRQADSLSYDAFLVGSTRGGGRTFAAGFGKVKWIFDYHADTLWPKTDYPNRRDNLASVKRQIEGTAWADGQQEKYKLQPLTVPFNFKAPYVDTYAAVQPLPDPLDKDVRAYFFHPVKFTYAYNIASTTATYWQAAKSNALNLLRLAFDDNTFTFSQTCVTPMEAARFDPNHPRRTAAQVIDASDIGVWDYNPTSEQRHLFQNRPRFQRYFIRALTAPAQDSYYLFHFVVPNSCCYDLKTLAFFSYEHSRVAGHDCDCLFSFGVACESAVPTIFKLNSTAVDQVAYIKLSELARVWTGMGRAEAWPPKEARLRQLGFDDSRARNIALLGDLIGTPVAEKTAKMIAGLSIAGRYPGNQI
ncbi:hypothetical protein JCM10908_000974 [Rhodotorula pacifica]|uniref:uncharacterized protein n=1 Tax=Rhodotorula pacifica TaxID=1495444 RepID=UPI0031712657